MIDIKGLGYSYPGGRVALQDIDLHIDRGEYVCILGMNGSGKSTLVRHFNGLLRPGSGEVKVMGLDTRIEEDLGNIRRSVGMVFQNPWSQGIGETVEEDVAFGPENLGLSNDMINSRVAGSLKMVGMQQYQLCSMRSLSGGQTQKVAFASVLALNPECIVFDEVTSMLDPASRTGLLEQIKGLHISGKTVISVTHYLEEVADAQRLIFMSQGRILHDGPVPEVIQRIAEAGFELPAFIELGMRLKAAGIIENIALRPRELVEEICALK